VEKLLSNKTNEPNNPDLSKPQQEENIIPLLKIRDRIVWLSDYGPEYGIVKWIGHLPEATELVAGIEFVS
jgi:hypothetical protein